jgi:dTDP-4-dehydrorhamnose reductase
MKILVLGAGGMLGSAMFRVLSEHDDWEVIGSIRSDQVKRCFKPELGTHLVSGCDVENQEQLECLFEQTRPDVVVNCIALSRSVGDPKDMVQAISIYALLPQRLALLCRLHGARLVHVSTDGVFSGARGGYTEDDYPDARDVYGTAKLLGEVRDTHAITIRTSIIGHELRSARGLISWFLAQQGSCKCFTRAVFSGFPTVVLGGIVRDHIIPRPELSGIYHVAAQPISKFDLLGLVAKIYDKQIDIIPDDKLVLDRLLDGSRFRAVTGYVAPAWPELIEVMHSHH